MAYFKVKDIKVNSYDSSTPISEVFFSAEITAPLLWWHELSKYESTTMNKLYKSSIYTFKSKKLAKEDFCWDQMDEETEIFRNMLLDSLNWRITEYDKVKNRRDISKKVLNMMWRSIIDDMPVGRLITIKWESNYKTLCHIYHNCANHKLSEFDAFRQMLEGLPDSELIINNN